MFNDINQSFNNSIFPVPEVIPESGIWSGVYFYSTNPLPHPMSVNLTFANGSVRGCGDDAINMFVILGRYGSGLTNFDKMYPSHVVKYHGKIIKSRHIAGGWILTPTCTGIFELRLVPPKVDSKEAMAKLLERLKLRADALAALKKPTDPIPGDMFNRLLCNY